MSRLNPHLDAAVSYAAHGWPVFPLSPGTKVPLSGTHGLLEATTDERQLVRWWDRHPDRNIGIATGNPGPDVLDVDTHGDRGNGFAAWNRLQRAGLVRGPQATVQTPSRGLHAYFAGTEQGNGKLTRHAIDFRGRGGYVCAPGSLLDERAYPDKPEMAAVVGGGKAYAVMGKQASGATIDFAAIRQHLEPQADRPAWQPRPGGRGVAHLAGYVAGLTDGNRDDGTWWACWRAFQAGDTDTVREIGKAALSIGLTQRDVDRITASAQEIAAHPKEQAQREAG